jgi:hypothetical protein
MLRSLTFDFSDVIIVAHWEDTLCDDQGRVIGDAKNLIGMADENGAAIVYVTDQTSLRNDDAIVFSLRSFPFGTLYGWTSRSSFKNKFEERMHRRSFKTRLLRELRFYYQNAKIICIGYRILFSVCFFLKV